MASVSRSLAPRVAGAALRVDRVVKDRVAHLSLATQFLLASLVVLLASALVVGIWVGDQIESGVLDRTAALTGLYVDSVITPDLQPLAQQAILPPDRLDALDQLLVNTPLGERVVAIKVWSLDGTILYSPNRQLIGQRFPIDDTMANAARGWVSAEMTDLEEPQNVFERQRWSRLLEVYVPVRERSSGRIIALTEFYQLPDDLDGAIAAARWRSWAVVAGVFLLTYVLLAGIVRRGSDTIVRQQAALRTQVDELSRLLTLNAGLRERLRQAAGRATTLNEQALRRIGADLHDGPGQELALALLRLEAAQEQSAQGKDAGGDFAVVQGAVSQALGEIRAISGGLRLPELAPLTVTEVVERVVHQHRRLTDAAVAVHFDGVPDQAPLPVKIALFRSLQEALSNATRHARGAPVAARVGADAGFLHLTVTDQGPGFAVERVGAAGRLGLAGLREQAELLGGSFQIDTSPGRGTTLRLHWPLVRSEDAWPT